MIEEKSKKEKVIWYACFFAIGYYLMSLIW